MKLIEPAFVPVGEFPSKAYDEATVDEGGEDLGEYLYAAYLKKRATWPADQADKVERSISLSVIDRNWTKHIDTMAHLREGIGLRSYAQTNPLQDYVNEGYGLFREMNSNIAVDCVYNFMNVRLVRQEPEKALEEEQKPADNSESLEVEHPEYTPDEKPDQEKAKEPAKAE